MSKALLRSIIIPSGSLSNSEHNWSSEFYWIESVLVFCDWKKLYNLLCKFHYCLKYRSNKGQTVWSSIVLSLNFQRAIVPVSNTVLGKIEGVNYIKKKQQVQYILYWFLGQKTRQKTRGKYSWIFLGIPSMVWNWGWSIMKSSSVFNISKNGLHKKKPWHDDIIFSNIFPKTASVYNFRGVPCHLFYISYYTKRI